MLNLSIAICTYNGEQRLPLVLDRLRSQISTDNVRWEILIVDNNSSDGTADWVGQLQTDWAKDSTLPKIQYLFERSQGTAFARQYALTKAEGEWVAFLDDDNLPHAEWVAAIEAFIPQHPNVGAFHGQILGDYEIIPPPNFDRIAPFWAIAGGRKARCYTTDPNAARKRLLPPGAGIVVQRQAWLDHVPTELNLVGRIGGSMVGGEDIEAMGYLSRAGFEIWYTPEMRLDHRIADRLTRDSVIRHMHGIGLGRWQLRRLGLAGWQRPLMVAMFFGNDCRKAVIHSFTYRHDLRSSDVVAIAERAFYLGCLQSPFYGWMR
ncbi:MAG: hormogonium polysaccharide biosynthesis glycosyltransferase HpsE [Alkalinema sp. CAN_BIN05]|nr:hormogonium polysaccharide biosynthesis glycosyltransferase HpsE [Alkalinema sp. CAN_BIN05]